MVPYRHREMVANICLAVLLIIALVLQMIAPLAVARATDTASVWHLAGQKAQNISYTDGATNGALMVNVGTRGAVAVSRDLVHWESINQFTSHDLYGICWGAGRYVAVGDEGTLYVSADGRTWDEREIAVDVGLAGIAYGNGIYVAVGVGGTIVRSTDGVAWTVSTAPVDRNLYHITWGGGRFVAVGQDGAIIASGDGFTWQDRTFAAQEDLYSVAWGKDKFVAAGGGSLILTSSDGLTWTQQKSGTTTALFGVASQGGLLVAAGDKGTTVVSSDVTHWSVLPSPTKEILYGCAARRDRFVAVGSSDTIMWTSDLVTPASPVPTQPAAGATVDAGSVTLTWSAVPGDDTTFDVQTSATADFSKLILDKHGVSGMSALLGRADFATSGMTFWRVRTVGAVLASAWSPVQSFAVRAATPPPTHQTKLVLHVASTQMSVDGASTAIDVAPQIIEGRTLLPIKWVAEPLGATVEWSASDRRVTISLNGTVLELWIGKSQARVNGSYVSIDATNPKVVPLIVSGRTMLPVRFVAEQLGADVQWEAPTKTITITGPAS